MYLRARYEIMLSCWNEVVAKRPSFTDLQTSLDRMLAAQSDNTYIDFSINPTNLCYQVADEMTATPASNGLLHVMPRGSNRGSKVISRPVSCISGKISPTSSMHPLKDVPDSHPGAPRKFARTPSPTMEKPHMSNPASAGADGKDEGRRPRSMMLLQGRSEERSKVLDDDRYKTLHRG